MEKISIQNEKQLAKNAVDPRMISPLYLSRLNRKSTNYAKTERKHSLQQQQDEECEEIEIDGFRIPKDLNSVWAVSKVLNQTKGKLKLKELIKTSLGNKNVSLQHKVNYLPIPGFYIIIADLFQGKNVFTKSTRTGGRRT